MDEIDEQIKQLEKELIAAMRKVTELEEKIAELEERREIIKIGELTINYNLFQVEYDDSNVDWSFLIQRKLRILRNLNTYYPDEDIWEDLDKWLEEWNNNHKLEERQK